MEQKNYHSSIAAEVSVNEAFEKIANVQDWWAKNFSGQAKKLGDVFDVRFGDTWVSFKIDEVVPGKKIVWLVTDCYLHWLTDKTEWNGTRVVWEVSTTGSETRIDMTHVGLTPEAECYNDCKAGWDGHVKGSLFKLMTEGVGKPE